MASNKDNFRSNFDKLKSLITDADIVINEKFMTSFDAKQSYEFILLSNHLNSLSIEDNCRRYFTLLVSEIYRKNTNEPGDTPHNLKCTEYWLNFMKKVLNQEAANHIYSHFVDMNVGLDFIGSVIPITELKNEIKNLSKQSPEVFIDYLSELDELYIDCDEVNDKKLFKGEDLYREFKRWCDDTKENCLKQRQFLLIISKYSKIEKIRKNNKNKYVIKNL